MEGLLAMIRGLRLFGAKDERRKEPPPQAEPEQAVSAPVWPVVAKMPEAVPAATAATPPPDGGEAVEFDEEWYLGRYPDVARAVSEGRESSGLAHFLTHGRQEGRHPVPPRQ